MTAFGEQQQQKTMILTFSHGQSRCQTVLIILVAWFCFVSVAYEMTFLYFRLATEEHDSALLTVPKVELK